MTLVDLSGIVAVAVIVLIVAAPADLGQGIEGPPGVGLLEVDAAGAIVDADRRVVVDQQGGYVE